MNKYNKIPNDKVNEYRDKLSPRQANRLARFTNAFIALDRNDKPIVVLDEGVKPTVTAMALKANRLTVRDTGNVKHGPIQWFAPAKSTTIGTHN